MYNIAAVKVAFVYSSLTNIFRAYKLRMSSSFHLLLYCYYRQGQEIFFGGDLLRIKGAVTGLFIVAEGLIYGPLKVINCILLHG